MALLITGRTRRKLRIRNKIAGTTERPRLSVFRSLSHIYAQVIDDSTGKTVSHSSTLAKDVKGPSGDLNKSDAAKLVGKTIAAQLKAKGITKIVFDRSGYLYHGRIKALAEGAREGGLEF